jgi:hypothetical protein
VPPARITGMSVLVTTLLVGGGVSTILGIRLLSGSSDGTPATPTATSTPARPAPVERTQAVKVSLTGPDQAFTGKEVVFSAHITWEHERPDDLHIDFGGPSTIPTPVCVRAPSRPKLDAPGEITLKATHVFTLNGLVDVHAIARSTSCDYYQGSSSDKLSLQVLPGS